MLLVIPLVVWLLLLSTCDCELASYQSKGALCLPSKLLPFLMKLAKVLDWQLLASWSCC